MASTSELARALGLLIALGSSACAKKAEPAPSPALDASARARTAARLERALRGWQAAWDGEPTPPTCEGVVKAKDDLALCRAAERALRTVKDRARSLGRDAATERAAADLALRASRAERRLRLLAMEYLGSSGASQASAPPSASAAAQPAGSAERTRALERLKELATTPDAGVELEAMRRDNPYLPLLRAYASLGAGALRYLGNFVELGAPDEKARAVGELERLAADHSPWHALDQVVREARLLERDPAIAARLKTLDRLPARARPAASADEP